MTNLIQTLQEQLKIRLKYGFEFIGDIENIDVGPTPKSLAMTDRYHKLYFYKSTQEQATPLLLVYSLINRPYIFDLAKGRSLIEFLCDQGFDVYLLDWSDPTSESAHMSLEDMVFGTLHRSVKHILNKYGIKKVNMLGYCMGGTFASLYAGKHYDLIEKLVLLTPALGRDEGGTLQKIASFIDWKKKIDSSGIISGRFLKLFFNSVKPMAMIKKERDFWKNHDKEDFMKHFLPVEKWSNDTPNLPGRAFTEFLDLCFTTDQLERGGKVVLEKTEVDMSKVDIPIFSVSAQHDWIIPSASTETVKKVFPNAKHESYVIPGGHIGLVIGRTAPLLWGKLIEFYK